MAPAATATTCVVNPCAKRAQNAANMGRQSQQRASNQHKRAFKLSSNNKKGHKGDQLTLEGTVAFQADRDCQICKAKSIERFLPSCSVPMRAHHVLCSLNSTTRGLGEITEQSINSLADNERCKTLTAPVRPEERFGGFNNNKVAASTFFEKRKGAANETMTTTTTTTTSTTEDEVSPLSLFDGVEKLLNSVEFQQKHKGKSAPLAIVAFASEVSDQIVRHKEKETSHKHFEGLQMTVPRCHLGNSNPQRRSITSQKILHVDWERTHGMQVPCPDSSCEGTLKSDRSNFSKNKTLFPICSIDGAPTWCTVVVLSCPCCLRTFRSNEADAPVNLPAHAAEACPVETVHALPNTNCHLARQ